MVTGNGLERIFPYLYMYRNTYFMYSSRQADCGRFGRFEIKRFCIPFPTIKINFDDVFINKRRGSRTSNAAVAPTAY